MKGTLHKTRNEWTVRYEDYTQPSPLTTREIPLSNSDSQLMPLRGQLPNDQHIMDGMEVDFDVITIDNGDNGVRYAKLTGKGFYREEGSSEIRDKIIADFMNWFIRRYSTSVSEGTLGYADSMEREVTLEQMINHYNQENPIAKN